MSDRELLEMAAKAVGMTGCGLFWDEKSKCLWDGEGLFFDPLTDDGDALRLAVKLRLIVDTDYNIGAAAGSAFLDMDCCYEADNPKQFGADRNAATRRAIVRAAAEIGRGMK